jgi:hypothetical protein
MRPRVADDLLLDTVLLLAIFHQLKVLVFAELLDSCEHGRLLFEDTPDITARIYTSQAFTEYSVTLSFRAGKIPHVMITAGYPRRTVKKQGQLSKVSQDPLQEGERQILTDLGDSLESRCLALVYW